MNNTKINNILAKVFLLAAVFVHMGVSAVFPVAYFQNAQSSKGHFKSSAPNGRSTVYTRYHDAALKKDEPERTEQTHEEKMEIEREKIDKENENWMKERSARLTEIMKETMDEYGKWIHENKLFDSLDRNKRDELASLLGMKKGDKRKNYLGSLDYDLGAYYYSCRPYGKYEFKKNEATEQGGLSYIQKVEPSIKYSAPLSDKYYDKFKEEWKSEFSSPRFFLAETINYTMISPIFLYDNGADVVPMKISLDEESFTMHVPNNSGGETPVQMKTTIVSDYFINPELIDKPGSNLKRSATLPVWSKYSDLLFDDRIENKYIFRQESVKATDGKTISCIVVRPRSQDKPTPLGSGIKERISKLQMKYCTPGRSS